MVNEITLAKIEEIRKLAESAILSPTWSRSIDFGRASAGGKDQVPRLCCITQRSSGQATRPPC